MGTLTYIKNLIKDRNVASVTPSSIFTVKKATKRIDFSKNITLVEFGPGTGVFSKYLLDNMTSGSRLIMIELNKTFVDVLYGIDDGRVSVYNESAEAVEDIVFNEGLTGVDYILSGIPFSFLDAETRNRILKASANLLDKEGKFIAYQTSGHLKKPLEKHFRNISTEYEFRNLPPMCIYEADNNEGLF